MPQRWSLITGLTVLKNNVRLHMLMWMEPLLDYYISNSNSDISRLSGNIEHTRRRKKSTTQYNYTHNEMTWKSLCPFYSVGSCNRKAMILNLCATTNNYVVLLLLTISWMQEEFEDDKEVIRIRKSTKDRQCNDQAKKDKRTNSHLQNIRIKLKIE